MSCDQGSLNLDLFNSVPGCQYCVLSIPLVSHLKLPLIQTLMVGFSSLSRFRTRAKISCLNAVTCVKITFLSSTRIPGSIAVT